MRNKVDKNGPDRGLDRFDLNILDLLQTDNHLSHGAIAEQVGLSTPSVQRRISRLESKGVIRSNVAVLNPQLVGNPVTAVIESRLVEDRSVVMDRAKLYFRNVEEIQQCYFVNGGVSFIIIMISRDLQHFEQLIRQHFADNPDILTYRTLIVLDQVKTGLKIPLFDLP
ncbi:MULTISPECIES: Lrp/AsnC family transcriptional regulator [Pandoraea]|uniref:Lrp/AsnC family transcriptional regulator n=1 Tax=Pandoraea TaxID=93217 RepID=UPI001F5C75EE|nr:MULTISPECIES: Lrp/AsnC family transcriptional regulator [Pandoraea]MCI3208787.1 AsnC family transcriptional regulator [Pandoraea sp. LA3]MDN4586816.1 AsnC family transcriptional regulator [Pandoraea capi]